MRKAANQCSHNEFPLPSSLSGRSKLFFLKKVKAFGSSQGSERIMPGEQRSSLTQWPAVAPLTGPRACQGTQLWKSSGHLGLWQLWGLLRTMKQKLWASFFTLTLLRHGWIFSMVGQKEMRNWELLWFCIINKPPCHITTFMDPLDAFLQLPWKNLLPTNNKTS